MKKLSLRLLLSAVVLSSVLAWSQAPAPAATAAPLHKETGGVSLGVQVKPSDYAQWQAVEDSSFLLSNEPLPNLGLLKVQLKEYAHCTGPIGCYAKDMEAQAERASALLDLVVPIAMKGEKLALVLDIDETSLSNMENMDKQEYGYVADESIAWEMSSAATVLPGTLKLYNHARSLGMDVFFITGRGESERAATAKNLTAAGYAGWKGLALRTKGQYPSTVAYKSAERAKIVAAGYRIVMSVGDQLSDLEGTPKAEISVKLPNPFYYLP